MLNANVINNLLPKNKPNTPVIFEDKNKADLSEREILYKVLFDMKKDLNELKKITFDLIKKEKNSDMLSSINSKIFEKEENQDIFISTSDNTSNDTIQIEESLSLFEHEKKLIEKSLIKHKGKRKNAAAELGISERTLYRKLKEFGL
jgi:transcriptional regulator of acetoin/glycerol metabolism